AIAPFLPASGGGMEGFNPPPAPSDNSVFVCIDEPAQEMRLADKHSLAFDERIQEIIDRAKALYANKDLDIQIKEEADIERGVQSFFADIYKFDDHRNQLFHSDCLISSEPKGKALALVEGLVVDDSNILTDRSLDEPTPPQEIQKRNKKEKRFPIGTALVEMMNERGVIEIKVDNEEGAKVMRKREQARYEKLILEMAKAYLGYDFYMPAFIDFRGRIYRSSILHFHERDLARSLIIFSDPKYKKGDEIYKILVTAATFHFKSFSSTVEAQEWCKVVLMSVLKRICESIEKKVWGENIDTYILDEFGIEDPSQDKPGQLSYMDIAKNAKDPLQFLSSILLNLHTGDPSFRYNSPITKDALASAFQIISYFLLDEKMARRTNLIPD
nr:DNA-dependent RNA polymerase, mitochondrial [Tanacetum cinerariifolium]